MFVFRATKKLLQKLDGSHAVEREPVSSTNRLGDWTANLVVIKRKPLVLAVSNVTLLPVILPLGPSKTLVPRFIEVVEQVLLALGIEREKVTSEIASMREVNVAPTNDRRVLGSMNDFAGMLEFYLDERTLVEVAVHLADTPCGPIAMESPRKVTAALFAAPTLRLVKG